MPRPPLTYSKFLQVLYLMEVCIPALPSESGAEFLIFRWGANGYSSKPGGPRAAFMHRDKDEFVTGMEVSKLLRILEIPEADFWRMVDGCMIGPASPATPDEKRSEDV